MNPFHIGISGWRYVPWRGDFYPKGLTQKNELAFASRAVSSIEINGSFYSLQTPERYAEWYAATPKGFVFSVKAPRYITHVRRLKEIETPLANFFASGVFQLKEKLGAFLWQFPPNFKFDPARFEHFLALLPTTMKQARACAEQCDERLRKPGYLDIAQRGKLHHAVEVRHDSFAVPEFVQLLRRYNVALVKADTAGKWLYGEDLTADFVYIRLHGAQELYKSGYGDSAIDYWRHRIQRWSEGGQVVDAKLIEPRKGRAGKHRPVFCYFDNDVKVHAPYNARRLLEQLHAADNLSVTPGELGPFATPRSARR